MFTMDGMDPSMLSAATEMFAKMTPEQRAQMQDQAARLDPAQIQQAMNAMKSMTPEQRAHVESMARNSTPDELLRRGAAASAGSETHAAETLKSQGNMMFKQGNFVEATAKYLEAIQAVPNGTNDHTVLKSCHLNLSSCSLQMEKFDTCIKHCNHVLEIDSVNMKAYYRRGQAFMGLKKGSSAVKDLEKALTLAGEQDAVLIREKLIVAQSLPENDSELVDRVVIEEVTMERTSVVEDTVEDVAYENDTTTTTTQQESASLEGQRRGNTMDPDAIKNAAKMMESMDPATMEQMMKMSGAPPGMTMDPAMIKMAAKMMETMSPEDIQRMQDMSRTFGSQSTTASSPSMQNFSPSSMNDMRNMAQNPDMLKHMQHMMKSMNPDDLCSMMKASGVNVTPEQAKKMVDQLGNLNDAQLDRIAKVARVIGSCASIYQNTKSYIKRNRSMALAILVLLIALFLRWRGIL